MSKKMYVLCMLTGNFLLAFAVVFFILPLNILSGGVATAAIVTTRFIPIPRVVMIVIMNLFLLGLGTLVLGKKLAARCIVSTILYSTFVSIFSMLDADPFSKVDPLLAALFAGLLCGTGLGLVFRTGGSTGGMDIPALIIHKYTGIPQNSCVALVDGITILCGLGVYGLNSVLTGLVAVMASSKAISWAITLGAQPARSVMIISDKWPEIQQFLLHDLHRGVTLLESQGGYSGENRPVLMCVVQNREYGRLESGVSHIDPKAFMVSNTVHEVHGEGFTFNERHGS